MLNAAAGWAYLALISPGKRMGLTLNWVRPTVQIQMKPRYIPLLTAAFVMFVAACPLTVLAQPSRPGAYSTASVTNKEVVAAAAFAIKAEEKASGENAKLELVEIQGAESQVVAGLNYRLKLKVKLNGTEKTAEAIVWWQAWRKPEPYQLTSWNWK